MANKEDHRNLISVRDLIESDIEPILNYWYRSPTGFIEKMGVDLAKMGPESAMKDFLSAKILSNKSHSISKLNTLIITHEGRPVGAHSINPLVENDHGIFHANIWSKEFRGLGIGEKSYPLACKTFLTRFNLNKIVFKTPVQNLGAIRVKEKLGIRFIKEEMIDFSFVRENTLAKVYELSREEAAIKWPNP